MEGKRLEKINSELQKEIAKIIQTKIKNPMVSGIISVLRVDTDNDLYQSNVYISIYNSEHSKEQTFKALESCAGFVRKELSKSIRLRTIPNIVFILDESLDYSKKIEKILEKIKEDEKHN